tara:strand:- start:374 stop:589 length:216 start_codon:yes stop_codon:yes gene_type:complete
VQDSIIDKTVPEFGTIASEKYPSIKGYVSNCTAKKAQGPSSYPAGKGLSPLSETGCKKKAAPEQNFSPASI